MRSAQFISDLLKKCTSSQWMDESDQTLIFCDVEVLQHKIQSIQSQLPSNSLCAVAIKSNPLVGVLKEIEKSGAGVEAASIAEVQLALTSGFSPDRIVFDSPVKTKADIQFCLQHFKGGLWNADSIEELESLPEEFPFSLGLRVNPAVEIKTVASMNVSGKQSKFGEWMTLSQGDKLQFLVERKGLNTLHVHQGSQSTDYSGMVNGISAVIEMAKKINEIAGFKKITQIDIGGGFPVNYLDDNTFDIAVYFNLLRAHCPELFDGTFRVITEFGRYVQAHAGFVVSEVHAVKKDQEPKMAIIHVGADLFLRESYNPSDWYHRLDKLNPDFSCSNEQKETYNIGGPLCFGGDIPFRKAELKSLKKNDWLIIYDTGANSHALWSRHCSTYFPKCIAFHSDGKIEVIKNKETFEDIKNFWS